LPHFDFERAFGDVAVDPHFVVLVDMDQDTAATLFILGWFLNRG
jgi:hypothetical protein